VAVFDRNTTTGALIQKAGTEACISETGSSGACTDGVGLEFATSVTVSPDGRSAYVAAASSDAVAVFDRTPDTTPPDTIISSGPTGTITTDQASFTFSGEPASDTAKIQCRIDSEPFVDCSSPKVFTGLADGPHTAEFRAEDAAGNQDQSPATRSFTVDATVFKARIGKVKVKGPASVKRNRKATYKVKLKNSGDAKATGVRLKVKSKGVKAKKSVGTIAAGKSRTVKVKLKFKKPGKAKLTFKVVTANAGNRTVKKKITVRK
ncbi:MAG: CARDB domain-containing protein, partial [Solirubrobacterales bacterium]